MESEEKSYAEDDGLTCEDCGNQLEPVPDKAGRYACRYCFSWQIGQERRRGGVKTTSPFPDQNQPFELPTFNGYTVDFRLEQFRKADPESGIEFIEFGSVKGKSLLDEMRRYFLVLYEGAE